MDDKKVPQDVVRAKILDKGPLRFDTPDQKIATLKPLTPKLMLGIRDGQIVLAFNKAVQLVTLSEIEARNMARALRTLADKLRTPDRKKRRKRKRT